MNTARMIIRTYSAGIITLQDFSMPLEMPKIIMAKEAATAMMIQRLLAPPVAKVIRMASPRVEASGATAPKVPPMTFMSCPMATSSPVRAILV